MKKLLFIILNFILIVNVSATTYECKGQYDAKINLDKDTINLNTKTKMYVEEDSIKNDMKYDVTYKINGDDRIITLTNDKGKASISAKMIGTVNITVTVSFLDDKNNQLGTCTKEIPISVISNDVTLKSLTIDKFDLSGIFKSDKYEYDIELPYEVEKIIINAEATNSEAVVSGTGERFLNEGKQSFKVLVKHNNDGASYTINVNRLIASNDTTLKLLSVSGYILTPNFNSNIDEYTLNVNESVDKITINATPNNENATVNGAGEKILSSGKNEFVISVLSESGDTKEYKIIVNKTKGTSLLTDLKVSKYKISPKFNRLTFTYEIDVYSNIKELKIVASAKDGDKIEILGNENLKYGKNEIYVKVSGPDKTTSVYKIVVNKYKKKELINNLGKDSSTLIRILFIIFIISTIIMFILLGLFIKRNFFKPKKINLKKKVNNKNKKNSKKKVTK